MVPGNSLISERLGILLLLNNTALTTSVTGVTSSYISLRASNANYFQRFLAVVQAAANTGVLTVSVFKAADTFGTGATAFLSATLTGTNANNTAFMFDINGALVDTAKPFIALHADTTGTGCTVNGMVLAEDARYEPVSAYNATGVQASVSG